MDWFLYSLRNYAKFQGRATRPEYWHFLLMTTLVFIILAIFDAMLGRLDARIGMGPLSGTFLVSVLVPSLAVGARRLHDTGRSGWWQLVNLIPYVGGLIAVVLFALRGQQQANKYGEVPTHDAG